MNWFWIVSGLLMIVGGLMHTIIGEKNVIAELKSLNAQGKFPADDAFNLIRWFWYMGSFFSFWVGAIALIIGFTDGILENEQTIAWLLVTFMIGFSVITFGIVAILHPKDLKKLSQVFVLLLVTVLLWLGIII